MSEFREVSSATWIYIPDGIFGVCSLNQWDALKAVFTEHKWKNVVIWNTSGDWKTAEHL